MPIRPSNLVTMRRTAGDDPGNYPANDSGESCFRRIARAQCSSDTVLSGSCLMRHCSADVSTQVNAYM